MSWFFSLFFLFVFISLYKKAILSLPLQFCAFWYKGKSNINWDFYTYTLAFEEENHNVVIMSAVYRSTTYI